MHPCYYISDVLVGFAETKQQRVCDDFHDVNPNNLGRRPLNFSPFFESSSYARKIGVTFPQAKQAIDSNTDTPRNTNKKPFLTLLRDLLTRMAKEEKPDEAKKDNREIKSSPSLAKKTKIKENPPLVRN